MDLRRQHFEGIGKVLKKNLQDREKRKEVVIYLMSIFLLSFSKFDSLRFLQSCDLVDE